MAVRVASENTEAWLCLDNDYLARVLNLSTTGLPLERNERDSLNNLSRG